MAIDENALPTFDNLWDYDQPEQTEKRFRAQLDKLTVGEAAYVALLTQIARAQGLQRHFDAAHATLDQAAALLVGQPPQVQVRYWLERGRVCNTAGDRVAAQDHFTEAWSLACASGEDYYAIDAAHMLAIVAPPAHQHEWNLQALSLVEKSSDPRAAKWLGSLHNNIGWTDYEAGNFDAALTHFRQALTARERQRDPGAIHIARWCVAKTLRALGHVEEALTIQMQLLAEDKTKAAADGYVYEEMGECYLAVQKPALAQPYFARAYELLAQDDWLVAHEAPRLTRLQMLGNATE